jgi:hypothetical protein
MAKYNCGKYSLENKSLPKGSATQTGYSSKAVLSKAGSSERRASEYKLENLKK